LRLDESRADRVDCDIERPEFQRETSRKSDHAMLGRRVRRHHRAAAFSRDRRSVDNPASASARDNFRRNMFGTQKRSGQIYTDRTIP